MILRNDKYLPLFLTFLRKCSFLKKVLSGWASSQCFSSVEPFVIFLKNRSYHVTSLLKSFQWLSMPLSMKVLSWPERTEVTEPLFCFPFFFSQYLQTSKLFPSLWSSTFAVCSTLFLQVIMWLVPLLYSNITTSEVLPKTTLSQISSQLPNNLSAISHLSLSPRPLYIFFITCVATRTLYPCLTVFS